MLVNSSNANLNDILMNVNTFMKIKLSESMLLQCNYLQNLAICEPE